MKVKVFILFIILILIFSLTSCAKKTVTETTTAEITTEETTAAETTIPETTVAEETAITSFDIKGYNELSITFTSCLESSIAVETGFTDG